MSTPHTTIAATPRSLLDAAMLLSTTLSSTTLTTTSLTTMLLTTTLLVTASPAVAQQKQPERSMAPELSLSVPEQNRLGVRFEPLGQPRTLIQARLPGVTDVLPAQRQMLLMPFESRIEEWAVQPGQHVTQGQALVQLHSHDGLEFLQSHRRLKMESALCDERLNHLKQRQRNGLSARLDVQEKALTCQQLRDEKTSNAEVLTHLPNEWQNQTRAEFTLSAREAGWVIDLRRSTGMLNSAGESLAEFWPTAALRVRTQLTAAQMSQLHEHSAKRQSTKKQSTKRQSPPALQVSLVDNAQSALSDSSTDHYPARISRLGDVANASGLFPVWLEVPARTLRPGQRWQVHLPAGQSGWVIPASARIRAEQAQWMFVRTDNGVQPMAIHPISEGSGSILLDTHIDSGLANDLNSHLDLDSQHAASPILSNTRSIAISGTSALRSLWLAGEEGE